jgi:hypothetical protein
MRTGLPTSVKGYIKERFYEAFVKNMKTETLLQSTIDSRLAFCIVHWNAPDFLALNVSQIHALHPESKIYVLDNGSHEVNVKVIEEELKRFNNVTLLAVKNEHQPLIGKLFPKVAARLKGWFSPTLALQFLLNYSSEQSDETAVFLDQDCILMHRINGLASMLGENTLIIGARDYVVIPKDFGPLKRGNLRSTYNFVHASFMIMQPKRIRQLFGECSLFHGNARREPYHGISYKAAGKILFLEAKMHDTIPLLTGYSYKGITYAWHAWYSSRTVGLSRQELLDGLSVSWLREVRQLAYDYLKQIHSKYRN